MRSVSLLWALWTTVSCMPYTWLPQYKKMTNHPPYDWEVSSSARHSLLGNEASMLVAAFQAYCLLPGRTVGASNEDGGDEDADGSVKRVRRRRHRLAFDPLPPSLSQAHASATDEERGASEQQPGASDDDDDDGAGGVGDGDVEAVSFVPLSFPQYYCTRHFKRLPKHAPSAWDDCMWLLSLQEGESEAAAAQDASDNSPGTLFTAFRQFENEIILLKPFLMYCGVFASSISTTNICYMKGVCNEFTKAVASRSGMFRPCEKDGMEVEGGKFDGDDGKHQRPRARRRLV
jgi:hypothetical protein